MKGKYVKGYFALSRLLVSDFLLFNILFLKFNKKVQSSGVPDCGVLDPEAWILSPRSQVPGPGSQVMGPGSWVLGPGSWILGPESWVPGPGSWILGPGSLYQTMPILIGSCKQQVRVDEVREIHTNDYFCFKRLEKETLYHYIVS